MWTTAVADPPWLEQGGGKVKRGADRHYPLMKVGDIYTAMTGSGLWDPAPHSHLWMWYTDNHLEDAFELVGLLGFRYVRTAIWVKVTQSGGLHTGLGQYLRGAHEGAMLCVRGRGLEARTDRRDIPSVFFARPRAHSQKPEEFFKMVEARSKGPYAEFFARSLRPGWSSWGNEIGGLHE